MNLPDPSLAGPAVGRYRWGRLRPADAAAWVALIERCRAVDEGEEPVTPETLSDTLALPDVDADQDSWAIWDADTLIGYGLVTVAGGPDQEGRLRCSLNGVIDPTRRREGLGTALMDLMEPRAAVLAAQRHPDAAAEWAAGGRIEGHSVRKLLDARGYGIARYWHEMRVALPAPEADLTIPDGYEIRPAEHADSEAVRAAHNEAFTDHWGSDPVDQVHWAVHWSAKTARLDLSRVAIAPDGELVGYCMVDETEPGCAYVGILGTRQRARGQGIARLCLTASLVAAAEEGSYDRSELHVDSASPTGATRLYMQVGYKVNITVASYRKAVPG